MNTLSNLFVSYDVISFDIFDTLLMRQCIRPEDVFALMERSMPELGIKLDDYPSVRNEALISCGINNPTLDEIYDRVEVLASLTKEQRDSLKQLEISLEKELIIPRAEVVEQYKSALRQGKHVVITTDMYLPAEILKDILCKCGISDYEKIYVSCEHRRLKQEGLFEVVKADYPNCKILHVGDNIVCDGYFAKKSGIDFYRVFSAIEQAKSTMFGRVINQARNLSERMLVGCSVANLFNNPFTYDSQYAFPVIESPYQLGYSLLGPAVAALSIWLMNNCKDKPQAKVLFGARDGYLIQKIYTRLSSKFESFNLPESTYFFVSRKAALRAGMTDEKDIDGALLTPFSGDANDVLKNMFLIDESKLKNENYSWWDFNKAAYIKTKKDLIYERSAQLAEYYRMYAKKQGIEEGKEYIFFDLVSQGTCQYYLSKILGIDLQGLYLGKKIETSLLGRKANVVGMWEEGTSDENHYILRNYLILEKYLTDPFRGSVSYIDTDGNPVFSKESRMQTTIDEIIKVQAGVMDFVTQFIDIAWSEKEEISKSLVSDIYSFTENEMIDVRYESDGFGIVDDLNGTNVVVK